MIQLLTGVANAVRGIVFGLLVMGGISWMIFGGEVVVRYAGY